VRVELHNELRSPQIIRATRVVIYDDFGNPIAVVGELGNRTLLAAKCTDSDFLTTLRDLGLDRAVIVPIVTDLQSPQIQV